MQTKLRHVSSNKSTYLDVQIFVEIYYKVIAMVYRYHFSEALENFHYFTRTQQLTCGLEMT